MNQTIERQKNIDIQQMEFVTGTWATTVASDVKTKDKTAADTTSTIYIPLPLDGEKTGLGVKIKALDLYIGIGTADLDAAPTCSIVRTGIGSTALGTAAAVTTTDNLAAAQTTGLKKFTVSVSSPAWDMGAYDYYAKVTINAAASSVVKVGNAVVKFDSVA